MFCLRSTFYLFIRVHNVLKGWVLFPIDAGENVVCRVERGGSRILLGQVDPLLMLVSSDLAVTARSETKIDYTKKRRSFYVTLLSVCLLDFVRKKVRNSRTIDELLKDFMPIYIISIYQITNWNENFGFFCRLSPQSLQRSCLQWYHHGYRSFLVKGIVESFQRFSSLIHFFNKFDKTIFLFFS